MRKSRRQIAAEWAAAKSAEKKQVENIVKPKPIHSFTKENTSIDEALLEVDASELEKEERSSKTKTKRARRAASDTKEKKTKKSPRKYIRRNKKKKED